MVSYEQSAGMSLPDVACPDVHYITPRAPAKRSKPAVSKSNKSKKTKQHVEDGDLLRDDDVLEPTMSQSMGDGDDDPRPDDEPILIEDPVPSSWGVPSTSVTPNSLVVLEMIYGRGKN